MVFDIDGMVVFHSPCEHQASAAVHGLWDRPPAELVLEARANGGFGNDVHNGCAEFIGWLCAQHPRPGLFGVVSLPGASWYGSEAEHAAWYDRVMTLLADHALPPVLVNLDDFSVTQGGVVVWASTRRVAPPPAD